MSGIRELEAVGTGVNLRKRAAAARSGRLSEST